MSDETPQKSQTGEGAASTAPANAVVVKKYANRRLYNTESSSYITLENLAEMVRKGRDFVVFDARSGEDITRAVLTQIIVEEESRGNALLPTAFLRQLIGFYGDRIGGLGGMMPRYFEQGLTALARQHEQMREAVDQTMGSILPPGLEELRRQNVAMVERAMSLFSPFGRGEGDSTRAAPAQAPAAPAEDELSALRAEVARLKVELAQRGPAEAEVKPSGKARGA